MIGIFDSGLGGLTVVKQVFKNLPQYKIVYFGDTAHLPYGTKSNETIVKYSISNTEFLLRHGAKIIIVACHTASSIAGDVLRKKFPNIPIFDVVVGGLREAARVSKHKNIGIIGTAATIKSNVHENFLKKLDPKIKVMTQSCPLLVPLIEEGWQNRSETKQIIRHYLRPMKNAHIDTLILACTHYPLLRKAFANILSSQVKIVDPAEAVVQEVKKFLQKNSQIEKQLEQNGAKHKFFVSDKPYRYDEFSKKILGQAIDFEVVNIE